MVFFRKQGRRQRRKEHGNPKQNSNGATQEVSDDDQVRTAPCSCDNCQFLLHMNRQSHLPASCPRKKSNHHSCCPYCDEKRQKLSVKHRPLKISQEEQTPTSPIESQEELIHITTFSPKLSEENVPAPITLSSATSTDINTNKIPSDLAERKQHEAKDLCDAETSTSSRYSSSVVDAITQTSEYTSPQPTYQQLRYPPITENKSMETVYHTDKIKPEEHLEPQNKQQHSVRAQHGVYVVVDEIPNAKTLTSSSDATEPLYDDVSHSMSGKTNESEGSSYSSSKIVRPPRESHVIFQHESEVPLQFTIPRNNNAIYSRYKYVKQESSPKFYVYKLVDEPPEQTSSGPFSQDTVFTEPYLEDLHKSDISDKQLDSKYCASCGAPIKNTLTEQQKNKVNKGDEQLDPKYCASCGAPLMNILTEQERNKVNTQVKQLDEQPKSILSSLPLKYCASCGAPIMNNSTEQDVPKVTTGSIYQTLNHKDLDTSIYNYNNKPEINNKQQTSDQGISEFPTKHSNTTTIQDTNNSEDIHTDEDQRSKKKLHQKEDVSVGSATESTKKSKNIFKALKNLFSRNSPMKKSSSESEDVEVNSLNSEKKAKKIKNSPKLSHDSRTPADNQVTKQNFQNKAEEKTPLNNKSKTEIRDNSSENINKKRLTTCVNCNRCMHYSNKSSVILKLKETKCSALREKAQKPIICRSKQKVLCTKSTSISANYLNAAYIKGKYFLPMPFCYWFEIIDESETEAQGYNINK